MRGDLARNRLAPFEQLLALVACHGCTIRRIRRRLAELAAVRLSSARARFERLGIVDADGKLVSNDLPPDMLPDSDTTPETG